MPQKDDDIFTKAQEQFRYSVSASMDEREKCLSDRRFTLIRGAQWEGALADQFENKPMLEVNKIQISCLKIINEYLNNSIDVRFIPRNNDDEMAEAVNGIFRADKNDCDAKEAFDNAFWDETIGGMGGWRLTTNYVDEEDEEDEAQRISIEPVPDADKNMFFTYSVKADKRDAEAGFLVTRMDREEYKEEYDDDPAGWADDVIHVNGFDWADDNTVAIVEYYVKEHDKETVLYFKGIDDKDIVKVFKDRLEDSELRKEKKELKDKGYKLERTRKIKKTRVHKYLLGANDILEDCGYIAGNCIPLIPCYGKRTFIDGIERIEGHARVARDTQVIKNVQMSKLVDLASMSSIEKPIVTGDQILGYEQEWQDDNIKNNAVLRLNQQLDLAGNPLPINIAYTKAPAIPPAMAGLLQAGEQDIKDMLGANSDPSQDIKANTSGVVLEQINATLDSMTFNYMYNMAKALKRTAEVWLGMAKDIYVEQGRKLKAMDDDDNISHFELGKPYLDSDYKQVVSNIENAQLDVVVSIGATSSSKRASMVRSLGQILPMVQDPTTQQVITNLILMNLDGEGLSDAREFSRKTLVKLGVLKPNDEEQAQMEQQAQQPDPQAEYLQAVTKQSLASSAKDEAQTEKIYTDIEKTKADTAKIISDISINDVNTRLSVFDSINNSLTAGAEANIPAPQNSAES